MNDQGNVELTTIVLRRLGCVHIYNGTRCGHAGGEFSLKRRAKGNETSDELREYLPNK